MVFSKKDTPLCDGFMYDLYLLSISGFVLPRIARLSTDKYLDFRSFPSLLNTLYP